MGRSSKETGCTGQVVCNTNTKSPLLAFKAKNNSPLRTHTNTFLLHTHTHTHTHIYIYIYRKPETLGSFDNAEFRDVFQIQDLEIS